MSKMTNCKACGKEIAKGVKTCPSCGKDQRNWFMKHKIITGIIILVIIGGLSAGKGGNKNVSTSSNNSTSSTSKTKEQPTFKVGEVIKTDKFEITITSIEEKAEVGGEYFKKSPAQGGTYETIQWQYKNISDKPVGSFSVPTISLLDKNQTKYKNDIDASGSFATELKLDRKILSDLNPGITVKDAAVFEVSKDVFKQGGWKLLIKADGKDMYVNIN